MTTILAAQTQSTKSLAIARLKDIIADMETGIPDLADEQVVLTVMVQGLSDFQKSIEEQEANQIAAGQHVPFGPIVSGPRRGFTTEAFKSAAERYPLVVRSWK